VLVAYARSSALLVALLATLLLVASRRDWRPADTASVVAVRC